MVNFNNETTVTKAKSEVLVMIIIELRHYVLQALEQKYENEYRNIQAMGEHTVKARIRTLYHMVRSSMENHCKKKDNKYTEFKTNVESGDFTKMLDAFNYMEDFLHDNDIINFISQKDYDTNDPIAEDEAKGI